MWCHTVKYTRTNILTEQAAFIFRIEAKDYKPATDPKVC